MKRTKEVQGNKATGNNCKGNKGSPEDTKEVSISSWVQLSIHVKSVKGG